MYESFFGFAERPFQLTPNPRFLYLDPGHREALATLRYGLTSALGITLLIGEAGTGKTTLLRVALEAERLPTNRCAVLNNPTLSVSDFFEVLAQAFGLESSAGSKGRFLVAFEEDVRARQKGGGTTTIVVDEAHRLTDELFEEIRLLANIETETAKLVNLVLVGQPELSGRLNQPSLRQFKQRVVLRCTLPPLGLDDTAAYIASRISVAGADASSIFTTDAVRMIYAASQGIPRTIGVICENALLAGFAAQKKPLDAHVVTGVCRDLDLDVPLGAQPDSSAAGRAARAAVAADVRPPALAGIARDREVPRRGGGWFVGRRRRPLQDAATDEEPLAANSNHRIFRF